LGIGFIKSTKSTSSPTDDNHLDIIDHMFYYITSTNQSSAEVNIMSIGQSLGIQGVILGSFILAAFGWIVSANAAPLPSLSTPSTIPGEINPVVELDTSDGSLPPMVERLTGQADQIIPEGEVNDASAGDLFEASIAFTPEFSDDTEGVDNSSSHECRVSSSFPQGILQWCELITRYADQHSLDPNLIAAVMLQESGGQHLAYSHSGAVGLMQVMPRDGIAQKFMCKNGPCFTNRPTISELEDPDFNIAYGTRMLAGLNSRFGNIRDALKSYGPMDVGYSYADKVLAIFERNSN
jgi:hypothetical protein